MTVSNNVLKDIFTITKKEYDKGFKDLDTLKANVMIEVKELHRQQNSEETQLTINKFVDLYYELQNYSPDSIPTTQPSLMDQAYNYLLRLHDSPSSVLFQSINFDFSDRSWGKTTNNTTINNFNTPQSSNTEEEKKKEKTLEQLIAQAAVIVMGTLIGGIAVVSFGFLSLEILNHISRFYHDEGRALSASLLLGMGASYCLAMVALYQLTSTFLMAVMTTAAFAHPAVCAFTIIAFGSLIATPLINKYIREEIYKFFSSNDDLALVKEDNRFRTLTLSEQQNHDRRIDIDRVNFATLCKYDELQSTQTRQPAFYDFNSAKMDEVLKVTRSMRYKDTSEVEIELGDTGKRRFSLFKSDLTRATSAPRYAYSEPVIAQAYVIS